MQESFLQIFLISSKDGFTLIETTFIYESYQRRNIFNDEISKQFLSILSIQTYQPTIFAQHLLWMTQLCCYVNLNLILV